MPPLGSLPLLETLCPGAPFKMQVCFLEARRGLSDYLGSGWVFLLASCLFREQREWGASQVSFA